MELRHLRYFTAVAAERNFTRAAEKLGIAQPPLSQQIRLLEDEVGVQLFHRVPHGAELTAAGDAFLIEARLALAAADRAKLAAARAHRGEAGELKLGFTTSAAFNPIISATVDRFHHDWPQVALSLEESSTVTLYARVMRGELDGAFVRPSPGATDKLRHRQLADESMVVALPANHRLAKHDRLRLVDLKGEPFILFPRDVGPSLYDVIVSACEASGFSLEITQMAQRTASTVNLVAAHLGVSIVPVSLTQIKLTGVIYRPIEGPAPVARLAFATAKANRSPVCANFVSLLP